MPRYRNCHVEPRHATEILLAACEYEVEDDDDDDDSYLRPWAMASQPPEGYGDVLSL